MATKSLALTNEVYVALSEHATYLGHAEAGSPEWDSFRLGRIGGSEVGAIAGESKYESAYSLWAKKSGLVAEDRSDNEPMYWGRALEPVIIDRFEQEHPNLNVYRDAGTWVNKEFDFMLANPDAIYQNPDGSFGILEIKTARFADDWAQGVPRYYATQVQWYLRCFNLTEAQVAVLISGCDYREFVITADETWQYYDLERVKDFIYCVKTGTRPMWDGSESTLQAVRTQHPDIDHELEIELGDLGVLYYNALTRAEEAKVEARQFESAVLDAMGKARTALVYDQPTFIRVARGNGKPYIQKKKGQ